MTRPHERTDRPGTGGAQGGTARSGRRFDLVEHLPDAARRDFLAVARRRVVEPGSAVYTQTELGRSMYRIVRGHVHLSYLRADGRELLFHLMGPGDCLGVSTLIDGEGLPHTATARSEVELQSVDAAAFAALRSRHRSFEDALMHMLCRDIRLLSDHLTVAALDDLPSRLARRLLEIAQPGPLEGAVVRLAQSELATMFGASRQTVNKVLKRLEEQGMVGLTYGRIRLVDIGSLEILASSA